MEAPEDALPVVFLIWNDCTLQLDDLNGFDNSYAVKLIENSPKGRVPIALVLVRVKVIYRGGPLVPIIGMKAYGCEFEFDIPKPPPTRGKSLLEAILSDFSKPNLDIKIPPA